MVTMILHRSEICSMISMQKIAVKRYEQSKKHRLNEEKELLQDHLMGIKKMLKIPKKLVIDEDVAEVVKYIFKLCSEGRGPSQIARQLTKEQIVNPSNHYFNITGVALTNLNTEKQQFGIAEPFAPSLTMKPILDIQ